VTENKSLKRRVRQRMSKTGERYTAARRQVLARAEPANAVAPSSAKRPPADGGPSDELYLERTGRPWEQWVEMLDAWGAQDRPHPDIVRWLMSEHSVDGWWAQSLTVRYEKHIGRRVVGQRSGGVFVASATRTIGASPDACFDALVDPQTRSRWLPDLELELRTSTRARSARFNVGDGAQRLIVGFEAKGGARCTVSIEHERLADAAETERTKILWRQRLSALKGLLEG